MDFDKKMCPIVDVDGFIEKGKQFDIEVKLPEDNRNVIYGQIKDCYGEPVENAVVKLIEVCGHERKPVSHTFTDKEGEFVFGPLCPDKSYEVQIWANNVKHFKVCADCKHEGKCLKGVDMNGCDFDHCKKEDYKKEYEDEYEEKYEKEYEEIKCECKCKCKEENKKEDKEDCKEDYKEDYKEEDKKENENGHKGEDKDNNKDKCKCGDNKKGYYNY